jgi:predicted CXXCH cytochrome family protein
MRKAVGLTLVLLLGMALTSAWAQREYVGPENCKLCHNNSTWGYKYNTWSHTKHHDVLMAPTDTGATPQYQGHSIFDPSTPGIGLVNQYWPGTNKSAAWKLIHARANFYSDTLGPGLQILSKLPVTWDSVHGTWALGDTLWMDSTKSYQKSCGFGCHTTGDTLANAYRGHAYTYRITCEDCHGPGSLHYGDTTQIVHDSSSFVCGGCHTSGSPKASGSPKHIYPYDEVNNRPYNVLHRDSLLTAYWNMTPKYNPGDTGKFWWPDGYTPKYANDRQFPEWYYHSKHAQVGVNCVDCHDPHKTTAYPMQLVRDPNNNDLCTATCHTNKRDTTAAVAHTHHPFDPAGSGTSRCVNCHMASTFSSASTMANHTWRPSRPENTLLYQGGSMNYKGNPSSCAFECHNKSSMWPYVQDDSLYVWNRPEDIQIADSLVRYYGPGGLWWNTTGVESKGADYKLLTFAVFQNMPNPFVSNTRIDFAIPTQSPVSVKIYNSLGQVVRTLVSETRKAGRYSEVWDGKSQSGDKVPAGVYFYKVVAGNNSGLKKLVLVR